MEYDFRKIEQEWQVRWKLNKTYKVFNDAAKPKYYVLDMFPYPSGAGLHVGHPLGYIASDIYSRYKRLKGFNVLHPMGYDSFGLPAEQYALETGQHPAVTTEKNIATFRGQLDKIGFCYDWDRAIKTSDASYYKWTQWIFLQIFDSWFNRITNRAERIAGLVKIFETEGNLQHACPGDKVQIFAAQEWNNLDEKTKQEILMDYRLTFSAYGEVNWCEALGTVLANDEVVNGVSERGGHPVEKKKMRQWYLRITEYADRLLEGLERIEFSDAMKEMQKNWIGKSQGAEMDFAIRDHDQLLRVYTTRPDTIFGVDFMVVAPEHELVKQITTAAQKREIDNYLTYVKSRSERERLAEVKQITGCFTGAYAINPFDGREIPIWIAEYVLAGYGTGAIMAVPCGDQRDFGFARHFNIPITNIIGSYFNGEEANATKEAILQNSGFLNGLLMKDAISVAVNKIEELRIGTRKVNFRMRDAGFSRQRYWGEPFPVIWQDGVAIPLDAVELPLELPHVDKYGPGPNGEGPLANIEDWVNLIPNASPKERGTGEVKRETSTMPGYAGSSWYFLRYMDPENTQSFCDRKASDYWGQVDIYIGGTEHAVGHLLYSRMWTKILFDLGYIGHDEPFKKLVNQGMIQGSSRYMYRVSPVIITADGFDQALLPYIFISKSIADKLELEDKLAYENTMKFAERSLADVYGDWVITITGISILKTHVDVNFVDGLELDIDQFKKWRNGEYANAKFINEDDGTYICGVETEKMSKSKYNTVNPDILVDKYGADTFRMYEMFLGPVEQSKPWDTKGIEGVHRFLRKLWRLFYDEGKGKLWNENKATDAELKVLHRSIKKIEEDTERFSFNTAVSTFMICVNELADLKCNKKEVLENVLILLTPYAPHIAEELWNRLGNSNSILDAAYPVFDGKYLVESSKEYPISINGKVRANINLALSLEQAEVEKIVLENEVVQKWLDGREPKKIIYVKNKMVNVVI
ncbi:MAG: leucine--tRNA ligase [Ferruginibacter sp.]|nr:leucine--tRNA ligase [Ferruginibacter sp.]